MLLQPVYSVEIPQPAACDFLREKSSRRSVDGGCGVSTDTEPMAGGLDPTLAPMASPSQPMPLSTVENRSSSARFSPTRHANGTCVPSRAGSPLVAMRESAGEPPCFHRGARVMCGAPKGIRNLTCGFQEESAGPTVCRIVAGQAACAVPIDFAAFRPDSGRFRAFPARKARQWHAGACRHFRTVPRSA